MADTLEGLQDGLRKVGQPLDYRQPRAALHALWEGLGNQPALGRGGNTPGRFDPVFPQTPAPDQDGDRAVSAQNFDGLVNENDLNGVMEWFAGDSIYDQFDGAQARGLEEIRRAFEPQFAGAFGVMKFIEEDLFVDADERKVMSSWECSIETDRGTASWRGLDLLRFDGQLRITRKATYAKAMTLKLDATGQD